MHVKLHINLKRIGENLALALLGSQLLLAVGLVIDYIYFGT